MKNTYLGLLLAVGLPLMPVPVSSGYAGDDGSNRRAAIEKNAGAVVLDREFKIRYGQELRVKGQDLKVRFDSVSEDSRCPKDVTCVWAGDAKIAISVRRANAKESKLELHTSSQLGQVGKYERYVIKLVALDPYPRTSSMVKPGNYVATLLITKE